MLIYVGVQMKYYVDSRVYISNEISSLFAVSMMRTSPGVLFEIVDTWNWISREVRLDLCFCSAYNSCRSLGNGIYNVYAKPQVKYRWRNTSRVMVWYEPIHTRAMKTIKETLKCVRVDAFSRKRVISSLRFNGNWNLSNVAKGVDYGWKEFSLPHSRPSKKGNKV